MKKTLIIIGFTLVIGISATIAIQNALPSKINILETKLSEIDADLHMHQTQLDVLSSRRTDTICELGAQKMADGGKVNKPKIFSKLCGKRLGLNQEI